MNSGPMFACACIDDYDEPSVFSEKIVVARKQHTCCECSCPIKQGSKYENIDGCWEGHWTNHKTCMVCRQIRSDFMQCGFIYTQLWEHLRDLDCEYDDNEGDFDWLDEKGDQ